ncbi:MAG: hypothetical protein FWD57_16755 [Polyangiaceae bacterium]|nr:hypothetical protein [Polyangiaceae bacterium]
MRPLPGWAFHPFDRLDPSGNPPLVPDHDRPLIIGVNPHTFCNPKVKGCGFCTFPHEGYAYRPMLRVVDQVRREIGETVLRFPELGRRRVDAVYFEGGTANLVSSGALKNLCEDLASAFDLRGAELTLEGVPKYFLAHEKRFLARKDPDSLLDAFSRTHARHRRISMGVQTFDSGWLARMGRTAFGNQNEICEVVESAHKCGFTVSADLLYNLPGESMDLALNDVRTAIEIGFDQICPYNLVLHKDLGTEWAKDKSMVGSMPDQDTALANWLSIRAALLEHGYVQTTLTNFERSPVAQTPQSFAYERASFDPASYDAIGFGPGAISTFTEHNRRRAAKWMNCVSSAAYTWSMREQKRAVGRYFYYDDIEDLRLLHLTRSFSRLRVSRPPYRAFFGTDPLADFSLHFRVLEEAQLVQTNEREICLTPKGMFFADAVTGLLSHQRVAALRIYHFSDDDDDSHMG